MHFCQRVAVAVTVVVGVCSWSVSSAPSQSVAGLGVRILLLKRAPFEETPNAWPLVGPQSALEVEWVLRNTSGEPVAIPAPGKALRLRTFAAGAEIPVRTLWATDTAVPPTLADGSTSSLSGSTKKIDGSVFAPGTYELRLDVSGLRQSLPTTTHGAPSVDAASPLSVRILPLDSIARRRQFHMIEGSFYKKIDSNRALRQYAALASLPDAPWSDSLPLAELYAKLGRHREACTVFRRILPALIRTIEGRMDDMAVNLRRRLRITATSFAVEGDTATAAELLRIEGTTPADRIPAEIERLRKAAARAKAK